MFLRLTFLFAQLFLIGIISAQEKAFHLGGAAMFTNPWILNQNNFGTLDGFNNPFARGSELDYSIKVSGSFGLVGGYNITKRHGIQFGVLFEQAGQKYHGDVYQEDATSSSSYPVEVKRNVKLNYLRVPLLYKFDLKPKSRSLSKKMNYFFALGPQLGYLMSVYENVTIAQEGIGNNLAGIPESDKFRKVDIGLCIENGVQFFVNNNVYLSTGLNLYFGLIDINGEAIRDLQYYSNNDVKYRPSYNFTAGINFGVHYLFISREYY
ncbi:MAG: PorT family protein [Chitinophagales bacterium]|nr:PorT family protein [Chitinophagales bacterium]